MAPEVGAGGYGIPSGTGLPENPAFVPELSSYLEDDNSRYRQMFEKNLAIKLLIEPVSGAIIDANPAAARFYGYSIEKLRSMNINEINTLSNEALHDELSRASAEQRNYFNFTHKLSSGEVRSVEVYSSPLELEGRHLLFSIIHDITDRKRAEAEIKESLSLLKATLEATADGILVTDLNGRVVTENHRFAELWGLPDSEIHRRTARDLFEDVKDRLLDAESLRDKLSTLYLDVRASSFDTMNFRDGKVLEFASHPQFIGEEVVGRVWSFRDVTERVKAVEEITRLNADLENRVSERTLQLQEMNQALEWEVAERRRTEQAAMRLASIVETSVDAIVAEDLEGNILSWNPGAEKLYGYSAEEMVGQPFALLVPEDHRDDLLTILASVRQGAGIAHYETVNLHKNGQRVSVSVTASPMRDSSGNITGASLIARDITERQQLLEQVKTEHERLATLVAHVDVALVMFDSEGRVILVNDAWARRHGTPPEEALGHRYDEPSYRGNTALATTQRLVDSVLRSGLPETVQEVYSPAAGRADQLYINGSILPVRDTTGRITGAMAVSVDVTQNVLSRQEAEQQRGFLETMLDTVPVGIAFLDSNLALASFNATYARQIGLEPDNAQGKTFAEMFPQTEAFREVHRQAAGSEPSVLHAVEFRRSEADRPAYFDIHFRPLGGPSGHNDGMLMVMLDVTTRHEANRQKDDFIALASHELKTPVATIKGSAQIAQRMVKRMGDERISRLLGIVDAQANRLTSLINELLDVTNIGTGVLNVYKEPLDLRVLVDDTAQTLRMTAPQFSIDVTLPEEPVMVLGDEQRLEQVVSNLVLNAVKYSGQRQDIELNMGVYPTWEAYKATTGEDAPGEEASGPIAIVSVRDYGMGIPEEQQARVFERFFRGRNVDARHYDGLGLGLFISNGIVSRHGGRMWCRSVEGEGSTFYFSVPLMTDSPDSE